MESMEELPDCHEGPEAFERFDAVMSSLLEVPKSLILRRQRAYRKKVDANPNRRGPKRKSEQAVEVPGETSMPDALPDEASNRSASSMSLRLLYRNACSSM
jgi:hypothetical protein